MNFRLVPIVFLVFISAHTLADNGEDCIKASGDIKLAACTRVIESGNWIGANLSWAYTNRGFVWEGKGDYDKAIADYNEAIKLNPQDAIAFNNRGNAWDKKADYDRAIADYNEAIRLDQKYSIAYINRGGMWRSKGDYDKAIADYGEGIRLNPQDASAFNKRGNARFIKGEFSSAAADFAEAQRLWPDIYHAIMLYLARGRSGSEAGEELALNTNGMDGRKWPTPLVALYLDKAKPASIISQAAVPDPKTRKGQLCEANFHLGEWHLLRGKKQQASEYFIHARNDCPKDYFEYYNSVAELGRIK